MRAHTERERRRERKREKERRRGGGEGTRRGGGGGKCQLRVWGIKHCGESWGRFEKHLKPETASICHKIRKHS